MENLDFSHEKGNKSCFEGEIRMEPMIVTSVEKRKELTRKDSSTIKDGPCTIRKNLLSKNNILYLVKMLQQVIRD